MNEPGFAQVLRMACEEEDWLRALSLARRMDVELRESARDGNLAQSAQVDEFSAARDAMLGALIVRRDDIGSMLRQLGKGNAVVSAYLDGSPH
jgi:hypothetical protein